MPREIALCLLKTAFVPRKCHIIKQGDTDQSHLTLWKAGQVKLIPGALPRQFVHGAQICQAEPKNKTKKQKKNKNRTGIQKNTANYLSLFHASKQYHTNTVNDLGI